MINIKYQFVSYTVRVRTCFQREASFRCILTYIQAVWEAPLIGAWITDWCESVAVADDCVAHPAYFGCTTTCKWPERHGASRKPRTGQPTRRNSSRSQSTAADVTLKNHTTQCHYFCFHLIARTRLSPDCTQSCHFAQEAGTQRYGKVGHQRILNQIH